jgi:hypothetical protein
MSDTRRTFQPFWQNRFEIAHSALALGHLEPAASHHRDPGNRLDCSPATLARIQNWLSGALLIGLGIRLAFNERR